MKKRTNSVVSHGAKARKRACSLGELLKRGRDKRGFSQARLAREIGMNASHVARVEQGIRRPSPDFLRRAGQVLELPLVELMIAAGYIDGVLSAPAEHDAVLEEVREELHRLRELVGRILPAGSVQAGSSAESSEIRIIPLVDSVAAGLMEAATAEAQGPKAVLPFPEALIEPDTEVFALTVRGDSMAAANICDGDTVLISAGAEVSSGDTALVALRGHDPTLKRIFIEGNQAVLRAANEDYKPLAVRYPDDVEILGKAVVVIHKL